MKNKINLLFLFAIFFAIKIHAQHNQNNSHALEDILSAKIGVIGAWLSYEKAINQNISVNSEIGYEGGLTGGNSDLDFILTSSLSIEPRFYYNYLKRQERGKNVNQNSSNYISLDFLYMPDLLTTSDKENIDVKETFSIVPKWGLRRSISNDLFFEFAFGIGYSWGENNDNDTTAGLDLKLGYSF